MAGERADRTRILTAALVLVSALVISIPTGAAAAPSQQEVEQAQARVNELSQQFEVAVERWNDARYRLGQTQVRLVEARALKEAADEAADGARARLSDRAAEAYMGVGTQIGVLLDAESMAALSDRAQFMGAIAQTDSDLAVRADATIQRAQWAAQELQKAVAESQSYLDAMAAQRRSLQAMLDEQRGLVDKLQSDRNAWLASIESQQTALAQVDQTGGSDTAPPTDPGPDTGGGFVPTPNSSAAQIAIGAARSKLGASYVFGAAGPDVFDCSGFVLWAWAQAGVFLPHSSAALYSSYPRVPLGAVQPGDIIYYGNFGPHVALYMGGGQIIHIRNPSPGGAVQIDSLYGYDDPWGAVRPT